MRTFTMVASFCLLAGCGQQEVRPYGAETCQTSTPDQVRVLYSFPEEAHWKIGSVSVRHDEPGLGYAKPPISSPSDPTVADASETLRESGFELGGEAVVVTNSEQTGDRQVYVTGEAICFR